MVTSVAATAPSRWSWSARRLGIASASALLIVGIFYVVVITLWIVVVGTPREPIGDPYLAVMEVLTMLSAVALLGLVIAIWCFADEARRVSAITALTIGSLAVGMTVAVHFLQITAVRQLWRSGRLADYRLVWPSIIFAVEYFAWDVLIGLTMVFASFALARTPAARHASRALVIGGMLCLLGTIGPFSGRMVLQNVAVLGYAVVLPIAGALVARLFRATLPSGASA